MQPLDHFQILTDSNKIQVIRQREVIRAFLQSNEDSLYVT